jgi:hypothetical protein
MTEASGGMDPGARPGGRWDVALSFAGAQRDYVGQVARALKARGVRCFYDADEVVRLWGTHLAEELPRIYARESAAVVVFVSADYAAGDWTRLERRAAFSRAVNEAGVYVLPARFDDSELPGLLPDVVYVDLRRCEPGEFADLVVAKLADFAVAASAPSADAGDPAQDAGPVHPAGAVRAAEADPQRAQLLDLAEQIRASRGESQREARTRRRAQANRVDVSKHMGGVPQTHDQMRADLLSGGGIRRSHSQGGGPWGTDFLTIRIINNSDMPVYDLAIFWRQRLRRQPWGQPDRLGILRPGGQVQRSRELPESARDPLTEIRYGGVVYFQDANGIRWRVMPDEPPVEAPAGQED